jgi:hypothetical protein
LLGLLANSSEALAADGKVWVNTKSGVYHCPGTRYYASTKKGVFQKQSEAERHGYRPTYGSKCFNNSDDSGSANATTSNFAPSTPSGSTRKSSLNVSGTQVWVNTKSGVYHYPGSRYYGATKSGRFMSEADAENAGNRPAYGSRCN